MSTHSYRIIQGRPGPLRSIGGPLLPPDTFLVFFYGTGLLYEAESPYDAALTRLLAADYSPDFLWRALTVIDGGLYQHTFTVTGPDSIHSC